MSKIVKQPNKGAKAKKSPNKTTNLKQSETNTLRKKLKIAIIFASLCAVLFFRYGWFGILISLIAFFVIIECIIGLLQLNQKNKATNYGKASIINGAILLTLFACYMIPQLFDCTVLCSEYAFVPVAFYYGFFSLPTALFVFMAGKEAYKLTGTKTDKRALTLNIIGIILSIVALALPAMVMGSINF